MRARTPPTSRPTMPGCGSGWQRSARSTLTFAVKYLEKSFTQGYVIYVLDKSRLSIRLQAPYSEERRRKASESAKQTGFKSRAKYCNS